MILSREGSSRATGYAEANKIVTVGERTHVAWLDSPAEGFRVRCRTLDRATGRWSDVVTIGEAHDNHGGPALTVDSKGFLHCVYAPHHHPFHYRCSARPNDTSEWAEPLVRFGERCTYPTLLCGPDDTLYLTCRESAKSKPWTVNLYTKPVGKPWQGPRSILVARKTGYSHFQEALAWGPDHHGLHLSARFYDGEKGHTVGYLRSLDFGKTWQRTDGTEVALPAKAEDTTQIVDGRAHDNPGLRCGSIAVDRDGVVYVLYSSLMEGESQLWLASSKRSDPWQHRLITEIPAGWQATMPGGVTVDEANHLTLVATIHKLAEPDEKQAWAHPTNEILRLESRDGGQTFQSRIVSEIDPETPHWLPSLERPTGFNRVTRPGIIYTAGTRATNNQELVANGVVWVQ